MYLRLRRNKPRTQSGTIMFNTSIQDTSLTDRRVRYVFSLRIALVIMAFFSAAWSLLQWSLATEPRFMVEGVTRQFVVFEATVCAVIAACAFLHLAANGLGWFVTVVKARRLSLNVIAPRSAM
jgi:hypothetical protein